MPTKSKKSTKITDKSVSKVSKSSKNDSGSKTMEKKANDAKNSNKKVIVKRRKVDLVPTRASAVAIASQANRAKKQALIEKLASSENVESKKKDRSSTRIPLWVWIFFGCSLLLFCISFYQAIIRPQFDKVSKISSDIVDSVKGEDSVSLNDDESDNSGDVGDSGNVDNSNSFDNSNSVDRTRTTNSRTAEEVIQDFFGHLSSKEFDLAFNMFTPSLQRSSEIMEHFTSFRMDPFISGIEGGKIVPSNIHFISKTDSGKDKYGFNVSYALSSNQEKYDEEWEFVLDNSGNDSKIVSILCVTSKCSYHPIFWPENFDLMK